MNTLIKKRPKTIRKVTMYIVIYARFSSHSQNEQSIEGQLKICYEYAKLNGYTVIGKYIDRAISGKEAENRPEFQRMIANSENVNLLSFLFTSLIVLQEIDMTAQCINPNLRNTVSECFRQKKIFR